MEFDKLIHNATPIEKLIQKKFEHNNWIIGDLEDIPSNWTFAINRLLRDVGKEVDINYQIACKHKEIHDNSEWLFDFVCYTENENGIDNVIFVAESQWMNQWHKQNNYGDIKYDFEKLLLARCHLRIMIFEANNENEIRDYIQKLNRIVANSKLTQLNDRYFYIVWDISKCAFYFDLYIHC